jgi:hypothetical protein
MLSAAIGLFRDLGNQANSLLMLLYMAFAFCCGRLVENPGCTLAACNTDRNQRNGRDCATGALLLAAFFALREDLHLPDLGERALARFSSRSSADMSSACRNKHRIRWDRGRTMSLEAAIECAIQAGSGN